MSEALTHEKYISIEYERWENYYKPMEEELKRVQSELASKRIVVEVNESRHYLDSGGRESYTIGCVSIQTDYKEIEKEFLGKLQMVLYKYDKVVATNQWYDERMDKIKDEVRSLNTKESWINERVAKIPFFIKWLFGIK